MENAPVPEGMIVKGPAIYTSIEQVLNANRNTYDAFINQGKSPGEALGLTFEKALSSPRTPDQDLGFIKEAMERGY